MGRLRNYEPLDQAATDEEMRELFNADGSQRVKLREGRNVLRFLPRKKGWKSHIRTVHRHFVEDVPGRDGTYVFNCPRKMLKPSRPCPECERWAELMRSNNPVDQDQARQHLPRATSIANVVDRSREADGPLIFHFGVTIGDELTLISDDEGDYTNPEEDGFDIVITRKGTKLNTKYKVKAERDNRPLSEDDSEAEEWIENQWSLDEQCACLSYEAIEAALAGEDTRRSNRRRSAKHGQDSDDEPRGGHRRRRDPDEEEEAPRKRHRSRAEDDEPRIPPARGGRARRRNVREEGDAGNDDY